MRQTIAAGLALELDGQRAPFLEGTQGASQRATQVFVERQRHQFGIISMADIAAVADKLVLIHFPQGAVAIGAGETGPFNYQWRLNGNDLAGATDSALPLNNVQLEQAGSYSVVVGNSFGSITSAPVVVDVSMLVVWGNNAYGQTNIPAGLGQIIATAGMRLHDEVNRSLYPPPRRRW